MRAGRGDEAGGGEVREDGSGEGPGRIAFVSRASLYSCLVTRQTGRTVRLSIERELAQRSGRSLTVLDFRDVSVLDFSCADEVVAKLAGRALEPERGGERYFLFSGLGDHHLDPVRSALERRRVAVAAEREDGAPVLLGPVEDETRRVWELVCRRGRAGPRSVAADLRVPARRAEGVLEALHGRRLLVRAAREYLSLRRALADARSAADGG